MRDRHLSLENRSSGTTLIELLIGTTLIGILVSSGLPTFAQILSNHRASAAINDLLHGMALARIEALKRSRRVYLAPIDGQWQNGWAVFVDRNDNRMFDGPSAPRPDEAIAVHAPLPASITITNTSGSSREPFTDVGSPARPYVLFDATGYPRQRNGGLHPGGIVVTDRTSTARPTVRALCLASSGRARIVVDRVAC